MNLNRSVENGGRLFTFLCLYIAQSIPMSFFSTVIPVIMRQENFSLQTIGLLQFMKLPWVLKFLWSPAIDRSCTKLTDYKRWIFSAELIYAIIILGISFLDLETNMPTIVALIIFSFIASATQDIATDALAVLSFDKKNKSMVNSMQSIGSFAGAMIGGGFLLLMYQRIGWNNLLPYLSLFVLVALIPLIVFKSDKANQPNKKQEMKKPNPDDLFGFFKQKGIWKQVVFLFFFYAGIIGTLAMLRPMLVDEGYTMKEIGVMFGIIGTSIGCIGSLTGGFIVKRYGCFWPRIVFAGLIACTTIYFFLLKSYIGINTASLHFGISLLWASYGMSTIVVYTTAMHCVRKGYEGTDFTIQTVITHLSSMLMAALAGWVAQRVGYERLFLFESCIAIASFLYIILIFKQKDNNESRVTQKI